MVSRGFYVCGPRTWLGSWGLTAGVPECHLGKLTLGVVTWRSGNREPVSGRRKATWLPNAHGTFCVTPQDRMGSMGCAPVHGTAPQPPQAFRDLWPYYRPGYLALFLYLVSVSGPFTGYAHYTWDTCSLDLCRLRPLGTASLLNKRPPAPLQPRHSFHSPQFSFQHSF